MSVVAEHEDVDGFQELLARLDPESRTFFAEADLGREAREWLSTDLGRFVVGCAKQEYQQAMAKLKTTPFWRYRRIQQLQNEIWRAENLLHWLGDLIVRGQAAEHALAEREEV